MNAVGAIKLLIAEDQKLIRDALTTLLASEAGIEIVAAAADGEQAIQYTRAHKPDVVLMDIQMPRLNGIAATRRILEEFPATKVIVLTTFDQDDMVFDAISAGAQSYLLKDTEPAAIAEAIRAVVRGESRLSPHVARKITDEFRRIRRPEPRHDPIQPHALTDRESKILALIVNGKSNIEIASALRLAEGTVKNYVSVILGKLHAKNRTDLAMKAIGYNNQKP
jgi:DNA-binding NarL/FixJ family response regulator